MKMMVLMAVVLAVTACTTRNAPLLFGQAHSVGIAVGSNPANQTPEITVGYRDVDIAVIPTVDDVSGRLIQGRSTDGYEDAYSTYGQFQADTRTSGVTLGKFFATGLAARRLSDGVACQVSRGTQDGCSRRPAF
jgi:hypothetical protein